MYSTQFPPEFQELQIELMSGYHNTLINEMNALGYSKMSDGLVHMATHCGILVEGMYTYEDKLKLCRRIATVLHNEKREPKPIIHVASEQLQ